MTEHTTYNARTAGEIAPGDVRAAVDAEIAARWPDSAAGIDSIHRFALLPPGKLLRPLLVCHSALAFGANLRQIMPAAIGFECAHVGSLLHDDIFDHDPIRRGRPAAHTVYGPEQAIVAGNALFFTWFACLAACGDRGISDRQVSQALAVVARTGVEVCRGAADELTLTGDFDSGVQAYLAMTRRKTGLLLSAACHVGGILADATPGEQAKLADFGERLGIAFQIRDDLLPYDDEAGRSGKPADSDLRNHRPTLPGAFPLGCGHLEYRTVEVWRSRSS